MLKALHLDLLLPFNLPKIVGFSSITVFTAITEEDFFFFDHMGSSSSKVKSSVLSGVLTNCSCQTEIPALLLSTIPLPWCALLQTLGSGDWLMLLASFKGILGADCHRLTGKTWRSYRMWYCWLSAETLL